LSGNSSVIGVGRRPLLQKIAAVTVAISMTIATADTFKVAKNQYEDGFMDSEEMVKEVVGGLEIRVVQVISDTFLWLAQVQTLIRLFPRHKEKVTIKWLGFALILLDVIFSSLNNFLVNGTNTRPVESRDAIPALSYLFELAIGFIYASCIIYYSISKYRFAFYHAKMRNICLVALLSITSVLIPVVFFVIDVSSPDIAAWGYYIRWVGAAAASVVVWEWVERIEALERDERKDGILGREIYDGDEMLEVTTANGVDWPGSGSQHGDHDSSGRGDMPGWKKRLRVNSRPIRSRIPFGNRTKKTEEAPPAAATADPEVPAPDMNRPGSTPPAAAATPISRADTTSAASTVYAVRYHNIQTTSPQILEDAPYESAEPKDISDKSTSENTIAEKEHPVDGAIRPAKADPRTRGQTRPLWTAVANPFKRKRASPPAEVAGAQVVNPVPTSRLPANLVNPEKWNLKSKIDAFATIRRDRLRARSQAMGPDEPLPVTIIPAQPRGHRTWSPDDLASTPNAASKAPSSGGNSPSLDPAPPSLDDGSLNVTIVPPPVRGQRTWSPEDLEQHGQTVSRGVLGDEVASQQEQQNFQTATPGESGLTSRPQLTQPDSRAMASNSDRTPEPEIAQVGAASTTDSASDQGPNTANQGPGASTSHSRATPTPDTHQRGRGNSPTHGT
jgi:PalH/RIM21